MVFTQNNRARIEEASITIFINSKKLYKEIAIDRFKLVSYARESSMLIERIRRILKKVSIF